MGWFTGIVVYMMIWWTMIFCVLPFGLKRDETGKPENLNLPRKVLITSLLSVALWLVIYFLVDSNLISFRAMVDHELQS